MEIPIINITINIIKEMKKIIYVSRYTSKVFLLIICFSCSSKKFNSSMLSDTEINYPNQILEFDQDEKSYENFTVTYGALPKDSSVKLIPLELFSKEIKFNKSGSIWRVLDSYFYKAFNRKFQLEDSISKLILYYSGILHWSDKAIAIISENINFGNDDINQLLFHQNNIGYFFLSKTGFCKLLYFSEKTHYHKKLFKNYQNYTKFQNSYCTKKEEGYDDNNNKLEEINEDFPEDKFYRLLHEIEVSEIPILNRILSKENKGRIVHVNNFENICVGVQKFYIDKMDTIYVGIVLDKATLKKKFYPIVIERERSYEIEDDIKVNKNKYFRSKYKKNNNYNRLSDQDISSTLYQNEEWDGAKYFFKPLGYKTREEYLDDQILRRGFSEVLTIGSGFQPISFNPDQISFMIIQPDNKFVILNNFKPFTDLEEEKNLNDQNLYQDENDTNTNVTVPLTVAAPRYGCNCYCETPCCRSFEINWCWCCNNCVVL